MNGEVPLGEALATPSMLRDFYDKIDDLVRLGGIQEFERVGKFITRPQNMFLESGDEQIELRFCDDNTLEVVVDTEITTAEYYLFKMDDVGNINGEALDSQNTTPERKNVYVPITRTALEVLDKKIECGHEPIHPSEKQLGVRQMGIDHAKFSRLASPAEMARFLEAADNRQNAEDAEHFYRLLETMRSLFERVISRPE